MIERPQLAQHALFGGLTPEQVALVLPHLQVEHFAAAGIASWFSLPRALSQPSGSLIAA